MADPDMVGHTGDLAATIAAVEHCDKELGRLLAVVEELGGVFLVTSDHGNADDMVQRAKKTGKAVVDAAGKPLPLTSHTLAPVPVAIGGPGAPCRLLRPGPGPGPGPGPTSNASVPIFPGCSRADVCGCVRARVL